MISLTRFNPKLTLSLLIGWIRSSTLRNLIMDQYEHYTKNIIGAIKMQNNFKLYQYCDNNIGIFSIATHLVIALPILRKQKLLLLISLLNFLYFMASFLYCFPYSNVLPTIVTVRSLRS